MKVHFIISESAFTSHKYIGFYRIFMSHISENEAQSILLCTDSFEHIYEFKSAKRFLSQLANYSSLLEILPHI